MLADNSSQRPSEISDIARGSLESVGGLARNVFWRDIEAMGTRGKITIVGGGDDDLEFAVWRIDQLEMRWTRFSSDSEIMELNNHPGETVVVSHDTIELVQAMIAGWQLTEGLYDANVLEDMIAMGYDVSQSDPVMHTEWIARGATKNSISNIEVDAPEKSVRIPSGVGLDAGGIGKGLAGDIVVRELLARGVSGVCLEIGGEVRVAGAAPRGSDWRIAVGHPESQDNLDVLAIADGALATSYVNGRSFNGTSHVVQPMKSDTSSPTIQATAVCGLGWQAEAVATALLLKSPEDAMDFAHRIEAQALIVLQDGTTYETSGWEALCI